MTQAAIIAFLLGILIGIVSSFIWRKFMADPFAKLDASLAALPARVAALVLAGQANSMPLADVAAAADARAAVVDAIAPAPVV